MRQMEAVILVLVATIGGCFLVPDLSGPARLMASAFAACGRACRSGALFVAIGILGATVMPHNLYLHSALVQTRRIGTDNGSRDRLQVLPDRFGDCPERRVLRQRGDPDPGAAVFYPQRRGSGDDPGSPQAVAIVPGQGRTDSVRHRAAVLRAELDPDGHAGRSDRHGRVLHLRLRPGCVVC